MKKEDWLFMEGSEGTKVEGQSWGFCTSAGKGCSILSLVAGVSGSLSLNSKI